MSDALQEILIVGAGISGLTAALGLAALGRPVRLVEKMEASGGYARNYACKATDRCQQCGACLVDDACKRVNQEPLITINLSTEVRDIVRTENGFAATLSSSKGEETTAFPAVVIASGFVPFNPQKKPHLGYGRIPNMITGFDLEKMLRKRGDLVRPSDGLRPRSIAFVQCVGSRDASLGNLFCSRVCCAYSLRMAQVLKSEQPDMDITFFYMDVQTFGKNFRETWPRVSEEFRMVREMPGEYFRVDDDRVGVLVPFPDGPHEEVFDLLVLTVGMMPGVDNEKWARELDVSLNEDGFLKEEGSKGVFVAGSAAGPLSIGECISTAHRTVRELTDYLEKTL